MASATAGDPLGYRHGVVLYSAQTTYGTPVTPATACGFCSVSHTQHSSNQSFVGPGSATRLAVKGGSTYSEVSLRMPAVSVGARTLLTKVGRASGVVPLITFAVGYSDDAGVAVKSAAVIQDCKIQSLRLGLDASGGHGPLTADFSIVGGEIVTSTALAIATVATEPYMSYSGVFTKGGSAYKLRTLEINHEHTITRDHVIPGATPSAFQRGHAHLTEHGETISGSISRYAASGVSIQANTVSTFAMVLVLTPLGGGTALTLTFATCDFGEETMGVDEQGIFWTTPFTASTLAYS